MKPILFILAAVIIYNLRAWLIRHITKHQKGHHIRLHILIVGIVSTICILGFPKLIAMTGLAPEKFGQNMTTTVLIFNGIYLLLSSGLFYLAYKHKFFSKKIYLTRGTFLLIYLGISNLFVLLGIDSMFIYFMLVAFGEEYIKYTYGYSLFKTFKIHHTDILLFALLSGFAFAFVENGVYGRYGVEASNVQGILPQISIFAKILMQRGIVNIVVHGLFTAIIGGLTLQVVRQDTTSVSKIITKTAIAVIIGGGVHISFNYLQTIGFSIIMPIVVLGGYIFITYITYKSDTIFRAR